VAIIEKFYPELSIFRREITARIVRSSGNIRASGYSERQPEQVNFRARVRLSVMVMAIRSVKNRRTA